VLRFGGGVCVCAKTSAGNGSVGMVRKGAAFGGWMAAQAYVSSGCPVFALMLCWEPEPDALLGAPCMHFVSTKWVRGRQRGRQKERQRIEEAGLNPFGMRRGGGEAEGEVARWACAS